MADILGYARVSTDDQDLEGQRRRLNQAGAIRIFDDVISGKHFERPSLTQLLDFARPGDALCVVGAAGTDTIPGTPGAAGATLTH